MVSESSPGFIVEEEAEVMSDGWKGVVDTLEVLASASMVSGRAKVCEKTIRALVSSVNEIWELDVVEMGKLACSGGAVF